jgi:hypothetical protein
LDVILNGGEATVRDPTSAGSIDFVDGNAREVRNVLDPRDRISAFSASYGPSEGYRPPQDDIVSKHRELNRGQTSSTNLGFDLRNMADER